MFSVAEFQTAIADVQLSETQKAILLSLLHAGEDGYSASELCHIHKINGHAQVNLALGRAGRLFAERLGRLPEQRANGTYRWWRVLASDRDVAGRGFVWTLHRELREALSASSSTDFKQAHEVDAELYQAISSSRRLSSDERTKRLSSAQRLPDRIQLISQGFRRNADVIVEVLQRAAGVCEKCKRPAPFKRRSDGTPFLEVHHWKPLADGGEDTIENAGALCPNCHREAHFG